MNSDEIVAGTDSLMRYDDRLRWLELQQGVVRLDESIREGFTSRILMELDYLERKQVPRLDLVISSPGGGAYYAFAIYDRLRHLSSRSIQITALVEGFAASAAAMIVLQAADVRQARANARFLLHEVRRWVFFAVERTSDLEDEVTEMKTLETRIFSVMAGRCQKTEDEVRRLIARREVWMSASEALDWGLIDAIV